MTFSKSFELHICPQSSALLHKKAWKWTTLPVKQKNYVHQWRGISSLTSQLGAEKAVYWTWEAAGEGDKIVPDPPVPSLPLEDWIAPHVPVD